MTVTASFLFEMERSMGQQEQEFILALHGDPFNQEMREIYADWLYEQGRLSGAAMVRKGWFVPGHEVRKEENPDHWNKSLYRLQQVDGVWQRQPVTERIRSGHVDSIPFMIASGAIASAGLSRIGISGYPTGMIYSGILLSGLFPLKIFYLERQGSTHDHRRFVRPLRRPGRDGGTGPRQGGQLPAQRHALVPVLSPFGGSRF